MVPQPLGVSRRPDPVGDAQHSRELDASRRGRPRDGEGFQVLQIRARRRRISAGPRAAARVIASGQATERGAPASPAAAASAARSRGLVSARSAVGAGR